MKIKLFLWTVTLVSAIPSVVKSQTINDQFVDRSPDIYNTKQSFFERSGFGAVAVMPHVTSRDRAAIEFEYITLPGSGHYRIARRNLQSPADWWFIVNHRSGSTASPLYTYIGVFIAKRLPQPLGSPLQLLRNRGWREQESDNLAEFSNTYESFTEFLELQREDANQELFQQAFGDWHAIPDTRTDESSWMQRRNWLIDVRVDQCFSAIGGPRPASSNVLFQAHLIRFRVTEQSNSRSPVVWRIGLRDADAFYLKTFSPEGVDLSGEYCVDIIE